MILKAIVLKNFRNYKAQVLTFHERFNLIYGENAQGKTNLLEAVQLLCTLRPFKRIKMDELISFGEKEARLKGEVYIEDGVHEIYIILSSKGKTVKLNGKAIYDSPKLLGELRLVNFLPTDLELIKGPPQERRGYIDSLTCKLGLAHLIDLKSYTRLISQRNALLMQKGGETHREVLSVWDEKIAELGGKIIRGRIKLLEKLKPVLEKNYRTISGLKDLDLKILYRPSFKLSESFENTLKKELESRVEEDKKRGTTSAGPHRDQIIFTIDGKDTAVFASQGEAKTLALALKISEIELNRSLLQKNPILLLDDITGELDPRRKKFLFKFLEGFQGQVFATTTDPKQILHTGEKKLFQIKNGRANPTNTI